MSANLTGIKITQLSNIGGNISPQSLIPIVDISNISNPITDKSNVQLLGNLILSGAGGYSFTPAAQAVLAQTVTNAAQPNITSVGTLTGLTITDVSTLHIPGGYNGYYLQTNGTGNLSWSAGGGSGSGTTVLISEINVASSQTSVALTGFNPSNYLNYRIGVTGLQYDTSGAELHIRFSSNSGSNFDSGTNYAYAVDLWGSGGYNNFLHNGGGTSVVIAGGSGAAPLNSGIEIELFDPSLANQYMMFGGRSSFCGNDGNFYSWVIQGAYKQTVAVNAVQLYASTGNITSGKFRLYGEIR